MFEKEISDLDKEILVIETEDNKVQSQIDTLEKDNTNLFEKINKSLEAVEFIENVANQERSAIKSKIEKLITDALKIVYNSNYSIEFDYSVKRNKTSVDILLHKKTQKGVIIREMGGYGGGVADTISVPLKLLVLLACKTSDRILILDEPGKHIDDDKIEFFFGFLKEMIEKLGLQVIMCSHHDCAEKFATNVNYVSTDENEMSKVEQI